MAVVVGRMVAILEAQTAQFEARMSAAGQQLNRWGSATGQAHRGTMLLRTGLQQLAFEGLGGMPPALARVSAGMLTLFGPGAIMIGAIAVLGALAMAFDHAAKKAQELQDENMKVRDFQMQHNKMLAGIGPGFTMTPQEQLANLEVLRGRTVELLGHLQQAGSNSVVPLIGGIDPVAAAATKRIDGLTEALRGFNRAIHDLSTKQFIADLAVLRQYGSTFATGDTRFRPGGWMPGDPNPPQRMWQGPTPMEAKGGGAAPGARLSTAKFEFTPQAAQMLLFSLMAMQNGGTQGSMMALGGLATGASAMKGIGAAAGPLGWIGFGISALATIFGSKADEAARQRERHHAELMGALHEGPMRLTNIFEGDPAASLYNNRRQERLGGEARNGGL